MLTRKEAKEKTCPIRIASYNTGLAVHNNSKGPMYQIDVNTKCIVENCPKWKDEKLFDKPCKNYPCKETRNLHGNNVPCNGKYSWVMDKEKHYLECCLNCDKHFGRCGG